MSLLLAHKMVTILAKADRKVMFNGRNRRVAVCIELEAAIIRMAKAVGGGQSGIQTTQ